MRDSGRGDERGQDGDGAVPRSCRNSFRAFSSYLRTVSLEASSVARSAASAAASIVDRGNTSSDDQVLFAGFDKLEGEGIESRRVLLLGHRSGFQIWDSEEVDNVRIVVSRCDWPVFHLQMLPKLISSDRLRDKYAEIRPLAVLCTDSSSAVDTKHPDELVAMTTRFSSYTDSGNSDFVPTILQFYSLVSQSYVHTVKFQSVIYTVKCSSRVVAVSLASQIHCLTSSTLEREYVILTNRIASSPGSVGYGPLSVGTRWIAYSGKATAIKRPGRLSPKHLNSSLTGHSESDNLVRRYKKKSSKQIAAGIWSLGDIGYKKLSRYCSEVRAYNSLQWVTPDRKSNVTDAHMPDDDSVGMVIVRDFVKKCVISEFRAHNHPISALCFDPSSTLLVTASVQGHNVNVFKLIPRTCGVEEGSVHLYRLQRGVTPAVIQDISFSDNSNWIMVSSSRGTSHLFAVNPTGSLESSWPLDGGLRPMNCETGVTTGSGIQSWSAVNSQMPHPPRIQNQGTPITLPVVCRIRHVNNSWIGAVSGAAAAARQNMSLSLPIASTFCHWKENDGYYSESGSLKSRCHLLVFSPSVGMTQYVLWEPVSLDSLITAGMVGGSELDSEVVGNVQVEAVQQWKICQELKNREEHQIDIYSEYGSFCCNKGYPAGGMNNDAHKAMVTSEEEHRIYVSQAELQTHKCCAPLWTNPEIYFMPMLAGGTKLDEENTLGGELEIEKIPACMLETNSKDLVPVFDGLRWPQLEQWRRLQPYTSHAQTLHPSSSVL